jgi:hypothetical protein
VSIVSNCCYGWRPEKCIAIHESLAQQFLNIPNGRVVRGESDVNVGYSWHIDPASVEFADAATEVCDGRPSDVEKGTITSEWYCPWSAQVVAIAPASSR